MTSWLGPGVWPRQANGRDGDERNMSPEERWTRASGPDSSYPADDPGTRVQSIWRGLRRAEHPALPSQAILDNDGGDRNDAGILDTL
jgi:hypothetical protein